MQTRFFTWFIKVLLYFLFPTLTCFYFSIIFKLELKYEDLHLLITWLHTEGRVNIFFKIDLNLLKMYKKIIIHKSVILWEQYVFIWQIPFMRSFWQYKRKDTTNDPPNYSEEQNWYPRSSHFRLKFTLGNFFQIFCQITDGKQNILLMC